VGLIGGFGAWGPFKEAEIMGILIKRDEAKQLRDWPTADFIREELKQRGIEVRRGGLRWGENGSDNDVILIYRHSASERL
jgi:hypothetical protein